VVADPDKRKKVITMIRCLTRAGLEPNIRRPVAPATATIGIPLPTGNEAVVFEYRSLGDAEREGQEADRYFAKATGGQARARGSSVVVFVKRPTRRDMRVARACL
jgi:hypothetical protein